MMLSIFPVLIPLISPIDPYIRVKDLPPIQRRKSLIGRTHIGIFDETVVEATVLEVTVLDDFRLDDGTGDGEDLGEHVICYSWGEVADVEMRFLGCFGVCARVDTVRLVGGHGGDDGEKANTEKGSGDGTEMRAKATTTGETRNWRPGRDERKGVEKDERRRERSYTVGEKEIEGEAALAGSM